MRVFDRDPESIANLIHRGLHDNEGSYIGKNQARALLNDLNGISVIRHGFRIRPLGDANYDWLKLNKIRIQNPSVRVSDNQVIGYVEIESEENSNLYEKSARDGLKDSAAFERLVEITRDKVLRELENRRNVFRKSEGLGRKNEKLEREINQLFLFRDLAVDITNALEKNDVSKPLINKIVKLIEADAEEKNIVADNIKRKVALYQGQATLGRIVKVLLHEGRKPLSFFKNQIKNLRRHGNKLKKEFSSEVYEKLIPITDGLSINAEHLVELFAKIDPLAAKNRGPKKDFKVIEAIHQATLIFEEELKSNSIKFEIEGDRKLEYFGWKQDLITIIFNLIENSVYWIVNSEGSQGAITISVRSEDESLDCIDIEDNGKGIEPYLIEGEAIFDPDVSTKPGENTGLGLAIAGESATRLNMKLAAIENEGGALFRLTPKEAINAND